MAKVPFSKLEAKVCDSACNMFYYNTKGEEVHFEVKYYLPVEEKMEMISKILNQSIDENGYYNPIRLQVYTVLEVIFAYTNLTFTAKQKENTFKLYDQLVSTGIFQEVVSKIFEEDWEEIQGALTTIITNIYNYKNSIAGILDTLTLEDYSSLELDATKIQSLLGDENNLDLLRQVLTKLG